MTKPPTEREREILDFLRRQAEFVRSEGRWSPCCPSIELSVDRERAPHAPISFSPAGLGAIGWLELIELVHYGDGDAGLDEFPPPHAFDPPFVYRAPR